MADWSQSSDPHEALNQDCLASGHAAFGKSERLFHIANWAMDWLEKYPKTQDVYRLTLAQWPDMGFVHLTFSRNKKKQNFGMLKIMCIAALQSGSWVQAQD